MSARSIRISEFRNNRGIVTGLLSATSTLSRCVIVLACLIGLMSAAPALNAEPFFAGPKVCKECHEAEYDIWKGTQHFTAYKKAHKNPKAKAISKAAGGGKSMKKNKTCQLCHYTLVSKKAGAKAKVKAGPSCESCHGPSSDWRAIHNEDSIPHDDRHQQAREAGMILPFMHYEIAANCMSCHGLANPDLPGDTLAAMLDAGHPINTDFELVRYSQGSVRHRYYEPAIGTNAVMNAAEL